MAASAHDALDSLLISYDFSRTELLARLEGLSIEEYFWEPVPTVGT